jgi:iron complex transport system ATP-binding protein
VALRIQAGQHVAIVGPNGAGKSTLLRLMAGLLAPSSGELLIGSRPMRGMSAQARASMIAVLSQTDQSDTRLSVRDYVGLGCLPHRSVLPAHMLASHVQQALERCQLLALATSALGDLSGGERQRAQLARALAQKPRLLLLDEPTNHLDPRATIDLLHGVARLGVTVVSVLHNLALVPQWADRVAVLNHGDLITFDTPAAALSPPRVHQVFGMHAFYLPHPDTARPMLVMDTEPPAVPAAGLPRSASRNSFFSHYQEIPS